MSASQAAYTNQERSFLFLYCRTGRCGLFEPVKRYLFTVFQLEDLAVVLGSKENLMEQ